MEKNYQHLRSLISLFLVILLEFFSLNLVSSMETYFINCGSKIDVTLDDRRTFVADTKSYPNFSLSGKEDEAVNDENPSSDLYKTARIFKKTSSYKFHINENGTHLVRLHFFPFFTPNFNLSTAVFDVAVFDVSIPGYFLLSNFSVKNNINTPEVKEFLLNISQSKNFSILFKPSREKSFAFINAIEIFSPPEELFENNEDPIPHITLKGSHKNYNKSLLYLPLETTYRINVGGFKIKTSEDSSFMWRTWISDKKFLHDPEAAKATPEFGGSINYRQGLPGLANRTIAPDNVYKTAQVMNIEQNNSKNFNISWVFNVSIGSQNLLRLHFCDFVSQAQNMLTFNLYINNHYRQEIDPSNFTYQEPAVPFYIDYVVDSDDSGFIRINVGPSDKENAIPNAILNGLEIMVMKSKVALFPIDEGNGGKNHVFVLVGSVIAGVVSICIVILALFFMSKCRKPKPENRRLNEESTYNPLSIGTNTNVSTTHNLNLDLKISFAEIQFATNNFDKKFLIGVGGFGKVYKGVLKNNVKVAVKRSQKREGSRSGQGLQEFETEILIFSKIRHRHLVSLIGYCDEGSEMILVYEFMENGTLREHLYDSELPSLSWKQRLEVCIGAARGLHYLHTGLASGIIHRDIKTTNILLDGNFIAKVADFGLSRTGPSIDETHVSTAVKGSFGYLDPEYLRRQRLTEKSDVYSFGVVLLEVLCARPPINQLLPREEVNLAYWAMKLQKKGLIEQIIDPLLMGKINSNCLRKFMETAEKCLRDFGVDRPSMSDVVWDLEYAFKLQENPMNREPHEDSTTMEGLELSSLGIHRLPSINLPNKREDHNMNITIDVSSNASESQLVFSQLTIDEGR